MRCASACALAWLGGRVRLMGKDALVGFHAAYSGKDSQVTSWGNALVGAYLNQLGLPSSAVVYITETPPNEIRWLSRTDARKVGIDVRYFVPPQQAAAPTPKVDAKPTAAEMARKTTETERFVRRYWNELSDNSATAFQAQIYAPDVKYFGRKKSREEVIKARAEFFERWPNRQYTLDLNSLTAACDGNICSAMGIVSWEMFSGTRESASRDNALFSLLLDWSGGKPLIIEESWKVQSHKVASTSAPPVQAGSDRSESDPLHRQREAAPLVEIARNVGLMIRSMSYMGGCARPPASMGPTSIIWGRGNPRKPLR